MTTPNAGGEAGQGFKLLFLGARARRPADKRGCNSRRLGASIPSNESAEWNGCGRFEVSLNPAHLIGNMCKGNPMSAETPQNRSQTCQLSESPEFLDGLSRLKRRLGGWITGLAGGF
jgi:hypothetical protein